MSDRTAAAPEVSVFIQTYQHASYIRNAIDGVLGQRAPFDFEIVIADDCSSDGTREILLEYCSRYPDRIRLLLPERNLGPTQLFRGAVAELRGRYVAWLDGDDYWSDDEKLALQVKALCEHPQWAACFHDATVEDADGNRPDRPYVPVIERASVTLFDLLRQNCVPSLSVMARGDLVRALPDWVWSGLWSDWLALIALAQQGEIGYLPRLMGVYRTHRDGLCAGLSRRDQLEEDLRFFGALREALSEEHQATIESSVRERRCQLAVEQAGVPYTGAVAVLGPEDETPTYLNGRNVLQLGIGEDLVTLAQRDRDGSLAAQLDRFRLQAESLEPAHAHFASVEPPALPQVPRLHLLVVEPTASWLERESRLGRQLPDRSEALSRGEDCTLLRVDAALGPPAPLGAIAEIGAVAVRPESEELDAHLDLPVAGRIVDAHAVEVAGWAIGKEDVVVAVELVREGRPFRRIATGGRRLDLERPFPRRPDVHFAGFDTTVSFVGMSGDTTVEVRAVLRDGSRVSLASIPMRAGYHETMPASAAPLVSVVVPGDGPVHDLEAAIECLLAQTYTKLEPIVIDGPGAKSRLVVAAYPGVRRVPREGSGLAAAWGSGIRKSRGDLVVLLDTGDRLLPRALELGVAQLSRRPDAAFTFGRQRAAGPGELPAQADEQPRTATAMFRRSALERAGVLAEGGRVEDGRSLAQLLSHEAAAPHDGLVAELGAR
jgi:glycosyltransferase involved in cell wall biosynthesis